MRFYTKQHKFYCGIDLHARKMYLCILDETGEVRLHQNIKGSSAECVGGFQELEVWGSTGLTKK